MPFLELNRHDTLEFLNLILHLFFETSHCLIIINHLLLFIYISKDIYQYFHSMLNFLDGLHLFPDIVALMSSEQGTRVATRYSAIDTDQLKRLLMLSTKCFLWLLWSSHAHWLKSKSSLEISYLTCWMIRGIHFGHIAEVLYWVRL